MRMPGEKTRKNATEGSLAALLAHLQLRLLLLVLRHHLRLLLWLLLQVRDPSVLPLPSSSSSSTLTLTCVHGAVSETPPVSSVAEQQGDHSSQSIVWPRHPSP
eukprot:COSAG02_NODE_193_length_29843_cov_30.519903_9_plen_103_part_00